MKSKRRPFLPGDIISPKPQHPHQIIIYENRADFSNQSRSLTGKETFLVIGFKRIMGVHADSQVLVLANGLVGWVMKDYFHVFLVPHDHI